MSYLHPALKAQRSNISGTGLIAQRAIPRGTILWAYGRRDHRVFTPDQLSTLNSGRKAILLRHAYTDSEGQIILPLGDGKYINHSCNPNSADALSDDLDIAIRDIAVGEEVTYDYGSLLGSWAPSLACQCGSPNCRRTVTREPADSPIIRRLQDEAHEAMLRSREVPQPLLRTQELISRYEAVLASIEPVQAVHA